MEKKETNIFWFHKFSFLFAHTKHPFFLMVLPLTTDNENSN